MRGWTSPRRRRFLDGLSKESFWIRLSGLPAAGSHGSNVGRPHYPVVMPAVNFSTIPQHEIWRAQYRERRYARHLAQPELDRRCRDILVNLLTLRADGKISVQPSPDAVGRWTELFTHVLEEFRLRHGPSPAGFSQNVLHSEPFPDYVGALGGRATAVLAARTAELGGVVVKYGKRQYMEALYRDGALRVQPASFYAKPGHNGAVRDDELALGLSFALSREDVVALVRNPQDVPVNAPEQRLNLELRSPGDYWMFCASTAVEPRLFVDFDADACVIVRDQAAFRARLAVATLAALGPHTARDAPALYVDPLLPDTVKVDVRFAKHFRYAYQREYRFVWWPGEPQTALGHVDVELGSLADIAELVVL